MPTIDAIMKIEAHIDQYTHEAQLLLLDLTKAFGKVKRSILWEHYTREAYALARLHTSGEGK